MNVRKIIFLLMSTILVFRSFDVWGGCGTTGDYLLDANIPYSCQESTAKDNGGYQFSDNDYIFVMGTLRCSDGPSAIKGVVRNQFLQCKDGAEDYFLELGNRMYLGGELGEFLKWDRSLNSRVEFKEIEGATYTYYNPKYGCKNAQYWDCCDNGGAVESCYGNAINKGSDDVIPVNCKDGLIYRDGGCYSYDYYKGQCTIKWYFSGNETLVEADQWSRLPYTGHLYSPSDTDKVRVLKVEGGTEGRLLICRLKRDKYAQSNLNEMYCTSSNAPIPHDTKMQKFKCDETEGWEEEELPWCKNMYIKKDKVLTGLASGGKGQSCKNRGDGCRADFSEGLTCAYLYCSGTSHPDSEGKTCLTSEQYKYETEGKENEVNEEVEISIANCKNAHVAFERDVRECERSHGTSKFDWIGPKEIPENVNDVQKLTDSRYIVQTDQDYMDKDGKMTTKNKLNCRYVKNCECDPDKNMEAVQGEAKCRCIEKHRWVDSKSMCEIIPKEQLKADCEKVIRYKGCNLATKPDPCIQIPQSDEHSCKCVSDKYPGQYDLNLNTFECEATSSLAICLPLIMSQHAEWKDGECKCIDRGGRQYHLINGECLETSESVAKRNRRNADDRLRAMIEADEQATKAFNEGVSSIQRESVRIVNEAYETLNNLQETSDLKQSVWRNKDGKFNTMRLLSDSVAGVALGTVGGVWVHEVLRKNQIESGFEDIGCTVGGETVADFGSVFQIGFK